MITPQVSSQAQINKVLRSLGQSNVEFDRALYLLEEMKNCDSAWRQYLDILPVNMSNFPILWSKEELSWLDGSIVKQWTDDKLALWTKGYDVLANHVHQFKDEYALQEFLEAMLLVKSRSFRLPIDGPWHDSESVLVPWADTFNHVSVASTRWSYVSEEGRNGWYFITETNLA